MFGKRILIVVFIILLLPIPVSAEVVHIPLSEAISLALENNLDLKSKRKQAEELRQDIKIANALKNPQVQSNFLFGRVTRGNSSQVGLALPVEVGKRGIRKKIAKINLSIVEDEIRADEHRLKIEVMRSYFNVLYMKSIVSIMQEREKLFYSMKSITEMKSKKSSDYKLDVFQNDMKYKRQLVSLNKARANLLGAQFELNDTLNIKDSQVMYDTLENSLFTESLSILNINILPYQTIEDTALKYSYSLSIANTNIEKREAEIVQAKRKIIPDVTISGGYAYQTAHQTGHDALPGGYAGISFDLPVLYSYRPEIKKAQIVLDRATTDRESFENHLKFALKENYNDFKYSKNNIAHYKDIVTDSKSILDMYKKRYEKGQASLLNLIQVENSHQENLKEYIEVLRTFYEAYLNLMQNVGHEILLEDV